MTDVNANIGVHIDTSSALAELKNLQRQLALFHASVAKNSQAAALAQKGLQNNLLNSINATGKFTATMGNVRSSTESFTHALENNKLSMREYFRYAGGASKTFGRAFKSEFDTIGKVAEERVRKMQTQYIKMGRDANGAMKAMAITPNTLNMNDYATKTALAAQKQAIFNQVVRQGSTGLLNFGKNTQWAGRQLMVGFTVPLMYFGSMAAKTFMDLETQAIKFKRVYGDMFTTSEQTNKALADIQQLADGFTKYGVAVSKTMEMAASAAAMGKTGSDLTAQVSEATRLAVLGGVEQSAALETTISLTNAFGIAADELSTKINFLNAVENQTVLSIEDLTIAVPKAGPVVKQLGGSIEDLAFFLTAMREGGINASEGANALKSGLASLINPTAKASAMLAGYGINVKGIVEGNAGNVKETVIQFAQALDTLAPLQRAKAIEQMFGKFQFARLSTLFQNVTKDGTQASVVLGLAGKSIEELAILSERELKTVEDAVGTNFKESIEQLKLAIAPIGKTFLQAITPIVKVIGNFLDKFNNLSDGTKKFIVVATTLVGVIGPVLLMTFGLLANGTANIIKLFLAMRGGFLRLSGNTKILAEQTNYLNAEQLEAATVAASLNQAHTQLTQKFEMETVAVRLLRQAYIDATVAAARFATANPGMMMGGAGVVAAEAKAGTAAKITGSRNKVRKLAGGISMVPGSGNGDTIPAMLEPGEAVVTKDVMQQPHARALIQGLIDGKMQGFEGGTSAVVAYGKHQPFTRAHEEIADLGKLMAEKEGSTFQQFTSDPTAVNKTNVLNPKNKLKLMEESLGSKPHVALDPFDLMKQLSESGKTSVKLLLGSDRMASDVWERAALDHGITLEKVEIPRTNESVSATKLRQAVLSGDMETANSLIAQRTSSRTRNAIFSDISGANAIKFNGDRLNAKSATVARNLQNFLDNELIYDKKTKTYSYVDPAGKYNRNDITREEISKVLKDRYSKDPYGKGKLTVSEIKEKLKLSSSAEKGSDKGTSAKQKFAKYKKENVIPSGEQKAIEKALKDAGIAITDQQKKNLFQTQVSHIKEELDINGQKAWRGKNLLSDGGYINNYINTIKSNLGKEILGLPTSDLKSLGINKSELEKLVLGEHPRTAEAINTFRNIAKYQIDKYPNLENIYQAHAAVAGVDHAVGAGKYKERLKSFSELHPEDKFLQKTDKVDLNLSSEAKTALDAADESVKNSKFKNEKVTDFGRQISPSSGFSFKEASAIGGLYEKSDGIKSFVKPMMDEKAALAEIRATQIAREVHGLDSPIQQLKVMLDRRTGKKLFALESPYDPRFAEANLTGKFTKDEYFKQLVAANLRGDKDLHAGNLSGNVLADVGTAGVFDKASGKRDFSTNMKSMAEQAKINLLGINGGARRFFAESTLDIPKNMTPDAYQSSMTAEIDKALPKLKNLVSSWTLNPEERSVYQAMINRLEEGRKVDWKEFHKMHSAVLVTKDESLQDKKTKKVTPIKGKNKPINVKSSSGSPKDTIITTVPKSKKVVQTPKVTYRIPGKADAPVADPTQKQGLAGKAAMGSGALAGLGMASAMTGGNEKITTGLFAASALLGILPMLTSPFAILAAAVIAVGAGMLIYSKMQKDAAIKQGQYVASISATTKKMEEISVLTNTVGASQLTAKKREAGSLQSYNDYKRQGSGFGDTFLKSEVGKTVNAGVFTSIEKNGAATAAKELSLQLAAYISDGILTAEQANSIGDQIGTNLGDKTFTANVEGQLRMLVGPDGSNILKDPVNVRMNLINTAEQAGKNIVSGGIKDSAAAAQIASYGVQNLALAQAQADAIYQITQKQIESLSKELLITTNKEKQLEIQQKIAVLTGQQVTDTEKTNTRTAQSLSLAMEQFKGLQEATKLPLAVLTGLDSKARKEGAYFDSLKGQVKDRYKDTLFATQANTVQNKLAKLSDQRGLFAKESQYSKAGFETSAKAQNFEVKMNLMMASGQLNPEQATAMIEMFAGKLGALDTTLDLGVKTHGAAKMAEITQLLGGVADKELSTKLIVDMVKMKPAEFDKTGKAIALLQSMDGSEINLDVALKGLTDDNNKKLLELANLLDQVDSIKTPITKEILSKFIEDHKDSSAIANLEQLTKQYKDFAALPDQFKKEAISRYISIYAVEFEDDNAKRKYIQDYAQEQLAASNPAGTMKGRIGAMKRKKFLDAITKDEKGKTRTLDQQIAAIAGEKTKTYMGDYSSSKGRNNNNPVITTPKPAVQRDTTLDDLLLKLKLTRDASINAQGGLTELRRILGEKQDIKIFEGLNQELSNLGQNEDFINFVGGLDEAVKKGYVSVDRLNKKFVNLTTDGFAAARGYKEAVIGAFHSSAVVAIAGIEKQKSKFKELTSAGVTAKEAIEMLSDANFALSLSAAAPGPELDALISKFRELKKAQEDWANLSADAVNPLDTLKTAFDKVSQVMTNYITLSRTIIDSKFAKSIREAQTLLTQDQGTIDLAQIDVTTAQDGVQKVQDAIDGIQTTIDKKQRDIEISITRPIEDYNNQIASIQKTIETNIDIPLSKLNTESSSLSNDLTIMDHTTDAINKKYDKQQEVLSKISQINQDIVTQQKDQLGLASALSQGDIAAAADAIQSMRANQSASASTAASDALNSARDLEISRLVTANGQTRLQIEERQYQIGQQTYALDVQRLAYQTQIDALQVNITTLEDQRKKTLTEIQALEDKIYNIKFATGGVDGISLITEQGKLDAANAALKIAQDKYTLDAKALKAIEDAKTKELEQVTLLEEQYNAIVADIAAAELATIDWQTQITEAIRLAKLLVEEYAKLGNGVGNVGGTVPVIDTTSPSIDALQELADATAALADASQIVADQFTADAATAAANAAQNTGNGSDARYDQKMAAAAAEAKLVADAAAADAAADAAKAAADLAAALGLATGAVPDINSVSNRKAYSGTVVAQSSGGIIPKYFSVGGFARGTDTVPAMLTPGEFIMSKYAVETHGIKKMKSINNGTYEGSTVYNYNLSVNVDGTDASPDDIARVVINQIKQLEGQRVRTQVR